MADRARKASVASRSRLSRDSKPCMRGSCLPSSEPKPHAPSTRLAASAAQKPTESSCIKEAHSTRVRTCSSRHTCNEVSCARAMPCSRCGTEKAAPRPRAHRTTYDESAREQKSPASATPIGEFCFLTCRVLILHAHELCVATWHALGQSQQHLARGLGVRPGTVSVAERNP